MKIHVKRRLIELLLFIFTLLSFIFYLTVRLILFIILILS